MRRKRLPPAATRRPARPTNVADVRRTLPVGFELDDDPARIDVDELHRFLSTEAYWALGRSRSTVERLVREASRVVGLYGGARQIGFARVVSDGAAFAYLADVYVLPEFRGQGLGEELVREAVTGSPLAEVRWLLPVGAAHGASRRTGLEAPRPRWLIGNCGARGDGRGRA